MSTVMREMVQFTNSTAQALEYARNQDRTWSVFLGTGDTGNNFDVLQYVSQGQCAVFVLGGECLLIV